MGVRIICANCNVPLFETTEAFNINMPASSKHVIAIPPMQQPTEDARMEPCYNCGITHYKADN